MIDVRVVMTGADGGAVAVVERVAARAVEQTAPRREQRLRQSVGGRTRREDGVAAEGVEQRLPRHVVFIR